MPTPNAFIDLLASDARTAQYVQHPVTAAWQLAVYDGDTRRQRVALDDLPDGSYAAFTVREGLTGTPYTVTLAAPLVIGTAPPAPISPYVQAWAAAVAGAGGSIPPTHQAALSVLKDELDAEGLWAGAKALYPFVPGLVESSFNFRDSAAFRLTYSPGGLTPGAGGLSSDGTGYYNTGFVPDQHAAGADSLGFDVAEDFTSPTLTYTLGVSDYSGSKQIGFYRAGVVESHSGVFAYMGTTDAQADAVTFLLNAATMYSVQRAASGLLQLYQFGRQVVEIPSTANGLSGQGFPVFGFAKNNFGGPNSIASGTHAHLVIRDGLSAAQVEKLAAILHRYHIATGRFGKANVAFGDSITAGLSPVGSTVTSSWFKLYCAATGTYKQNWAVSGQQGAEIIGAGGLLDRHLAVYDPAIHGLTLLCHGTNDTNNGINGTDYAQILDAQIALALAKGVPAASIVALPAFYQRGDTNGAARLDYLDKCATVCAARGARLLNVYQPMKDFPNVDTLCFDASDGVHYNQFGQQKLADFVAAAL